MSNFSSKLQQKLTCDPVIIKSDLVKTDPVINKTDLVITKSDLAKIHEHRQGNFFLKSLTL